MTTNQQPIDDNKFSEKIVETAANFPYPPTPDIALAVQRRIQPLRARQVYPQPQLLGLAVLMLMLIFAFLAVSPARAMLLSWLRIGVIEMSSENGAIATPIALQDLPGRMTLAEAETAVSYPIQWPSALNEPTHVFVISNSALLVWPEQGFILQILGFNMSGSKLQVESAEEVLLNGKTAIWITDDHFLTLYDQQFNDIDLLTRRIDGSVLIWEENGLTYRLESRLTLSEAIKLADTVTRP